MTVFNLAAVQKLALAATSHIRKMVPIGSLVVVALHMGGKMMVLREGGAHLVMVPMRNRCGFRSRPQDRSVFSYELFGLRLTPFDSCHGVPAE